MKDMLEWRKVLESYQLLSSAQEEYSKLALIGGHSKFHLEGDALTHSLLVWEAAKDIFWNNRVMQKAALLHDIGKIYTSIEIAPGDWIYPDHSVAGSLKGILAKFVALDDLYFGDFQWLIRNHIRPLFWREKGVETEEVWGAKTHPEVCTLDNLRKLAICDLMGSKPLDPEASDQLKDWLWKLKF